MPSTDFIDLPLWAVSAFDGASVKRCIVGWRQAWANSSNERFIFSDVEGLAED